MDSQVYKLSDSTNAQIVKLIQLGILTGTNVSDKMRTMRVVVDADEGAEAASCTTVITPHGQKNDLNEKLSE